MSEYQVRYPNPLVGLPPAAFAAYERHHRMEKLTLGFIGLGRMGGPMSSRLVAAGYPVVGFDAAGTSGRLPDAASAAGSSADVASRVDITFLSVPDGSASRAVCAEIAAAPVRAIRLVVDLSTIGIAAARSCATLLDAAGVEYVDAPVSGGVSGAASGSLAMMVGCPAARFQELDPILAVLARHRFRVGDTPGQGQAIKLLNNYVSAAALAATCEAVVFGERLGLDLQTMTDVLNVSTGRSTASEDKLPRSIVPRTYDYGFAGALMAKDVSLYLENATKAEVPHELATAVAALWQRFVAAHPAADFTFLHRYLEDGGE
jgi:3-hydroxyisobutyrate dehydrogenase-like beta-hydroxyacid dehydrogenase